MTNAFLPLLVGKDDAVPPGVRMTLVGQEDSEQSMPSDDFLTDTLDLLDKPDAKELVVERARFIRDAVATGFHDHVLAMISGSSPFRQRSCPASSATRSRLKTSPSTIRCATWPR
ncbi:hypothetical protein AMES_3610 [Amycolatopsis mediterranei S699]|uniref:Uncharacterized protein n=2 Tax=Amycolatopsis mediterranei TaxID=33910 RepID=A0A0H3D7D8_AMYMU|nr:hypothetical protein [Amycolatopsis mediterranei]ADJ45434.1 conserved hypothetical protein [Amycolatopsis mediterranei U32]AEK42202.1 hypothetical protein RAM_18580 [Amycolatopsis mediterranei S699]AFO77146.1 hypothetical protein AMES_3610 [Amycolatopsis mediterranei S699]AGT84274.1 hypothetical protein B737_3610 [Amycolatopsis mediterranei RB]KDO06013.1 hypothetical protein DV26_35590 [Amycolatopsis mediterranei]